MREDLMNEVLYVDDLVLLGESTNKLRSFWNGKRGLRARG